MIIRILGEGQFSIDDRLLGQLNELDNELQNGLEHAGEESFVSVLQQMLSLVRAEGTPVPAEDLVESSMILPPHDATMAEIRHLIGEEGLIPDK